MNEVILNGIFTLSGVVLGSILTYFLTFLANKGKLQIYIYKLSCSARKKQNSENGDRDYTLKIFDKDNESIFFNVYLFIHNSKNTNISMSKVSIEFKDERKRTFGLLLKDKEQNISSIGFFPKSVDNYNFMGKITSNLYLSAGIQIEELKKHVLFTRNTLIVISYINEKNKKIIIKRSKVSLQNCEKEI